MTLNCYINIDDAVTLRYYHCTTINIYDEFENEFCDEVYQTYQVIVKTQGTTVTLKMMKVLTEKQELILLRCDTDTPQQRII